MNTHTYCYRVSKETQYGLLWFSYSGWSKHKDSASILNFQRARQIQKENPLETCSIVKG